jgi:hypothetical protein
MALYIFMALLLDWFLVGLNFLKLLNVVSKQWPSHQAWRAGYPGIESRRYIMRYKSNDFVILVEDTVSCIVRSVLPVHLSVKDASHFRKDRLVRHKYVRTHTDSN